MKDRFIRTTLVKHRFPPSISSSLKSCIWLVCQLSRGCTKLRATTSSVAIGEQLVAGPRLPQRSTSPSWLMGLEPSSTSISIVIPIWSSYSKNAFWGVSISLTSFGFLVTSLDPSESHPPQPTNHSSGLAFHAFVLGNCTEKWWIPSLRVLHLAIRIDDLSTLHPHPQELSAWNWTRSQYPSTWKEAVSTRKTMWSTCSCE